MASGRPPHVDTAPGMDLLGSPRTDSMMSPRSEGSRARSNNSGFEATAGMANKMLAWRRRHEAGYVKDRKHKELLDRQRVRMKVELPPAVELMVMEEALPIVKQVVQAYITQVGEKNSMTLKSIAHYRQLCAKLGVSPEY